MKVNLTDDVESIPESTRYRLAVDSHINDQGQVGTSNKHALDKRKSYIDSAADVYSFVYHLIVVCVSEVCSGSADLSECSQET
ncbi:hypothetical protein CTI12_AA072450 [Artemisia annua]|uniref:Uncharacterized protein n=1 Tax=Artemisia annua TaxID=35608 RepID=A0A2U1Q5P7_ARTAN|nr:hypothetical protein CTI12_AA072450 [Artemisia annua]